MNSVTVVEKEVRVFKQNIVCSTCEVQMVMTDTVLLSYPQQYIYICPRCGYEHRDYDGYPKVVYREVEDNE